MTSPTPETIEREREKLYVTDAELIRRWGIPEKRAREILRELDTKPQHAYLDELNGLKLSDRRG